MSDRAVELSVDDRGLAQIVFNRAEKHNAINEAMLDAITDFCQALPSHARLLLITARGKSFCAGGDLQWMQQQFAADRSERLRQSGKLAAMLNALDKLPLPVISMVRGAVYGGGLGILAVSDRVIASDTARFCFSETLLGLIPATIGPFVYAKAGNALRAYFLTAEVFDAPTAQRLNLVTEIVADDALDTSMHDNITQALKCDPSAVAKAKSLLQTFGQADDNDDNFKQHSVAALADCWQLPDTHKRIEAFLHRNS